MTFTPDGSHALYSVMSDVAGNNRRQNLLGLLVQTDTGAEESRLTKVLEVDPNNLYAFGGVLSPNAAYLAVSTEGQLEVFALGSGKRVAQRLDDAYGRSFFSSNSETLFVVQESPPEKIEVLQLSAARGAPPSTHSPPLKEAVFSPDRTHVAALGAQNQPLIWDASTGALRALAVPPKCKYCELSWRGASELVLVNKRNRTRQINYDVESGTGVEGAYAPHPGFQGGGFRVFEEFTDDNKTTP